MGCEIVDQDNGVQFTDHVLLLRDPRLAQAGYAVTKRGLVSPVSRIHTVRMRGEAPVGASSPPSIIYLTPWGDGTTSCTGALCARVNNPCSNRGRLVSLKPRARKNVALAFPTTCVSESK